LPHYWLRVTLPISEGSRYFIAHQYREAIPFYRKAFEIEKSTPTLDKNLWRVLIDNLSTAYGITHDLSGAREALTYGVTKDPDYPRFYYNLARITAEKGDLPDTENYLKLAFERRENLIPGETMPASTTPSRHSSCKGNFVNSLLRSTVRPNSPLLLRDFGARTLWAV